MTEPDSIFGDGGDAIEPRPPRDPAVQTAAFAERLLAGRSPEQAEVAARIYARLKAGAEVDDVRNLIERFAAATPRTAARPAPEPAAEDRGELRLYEDE